MAQDTNEPRLYGVSYGNGNDGVSHTFADFYCRTNRPWDLARVSLVTAMGADYRGWAAKEMDLDGDADYTISAVIYIPPNDEATGDDDCDDDCDDDSSWRDSNGAWFICEVFPVDDDEDTRGQPVYDSLEECHGADVVAKYGTERE